MALTATQAVRLKASDKSALFQEPLEGDGLKTSFTLANRPVMGTPAPQVYLAGVLQVLGYTIDLDNGILNFTVAPASNADVTVLYYWAVFTDEEIQYFLSDSFSNVTLASAKVLLAIASDAAKIAKRQTFFGTHGRDTIDTSVASKELRDTAKALFDEYNLFYGTHFPFDQLTEVPWTDATFERMFDQHLIRES